MTKFNWNHKLAALFLGMILLFQNCGDSSLPPPIENKPGEQAVIKTLTIEVRNGKGAIVPFGGDLCANNATNQEGRAVGIYISYPDPVSAFRCRRASPISEPSSWPCSEARNLYTGGGAGIYFSLPESGGRRAALEYTNLETGFYLLQVQAQKMIDGILRDVGSTTVSFSVRDCVTTTTTSTSTTTTTSRTTTTTSRTTTTTSRTSTTTSRTTTSQTTSTTSRTTTTTSRTTSTTSRTTTTTSRTTTSTTLSSRYKWSYNSCLCNIEANGEYFNQDFTVQAGSNCDPVTMPEAYESKVNTTVGTLVFFYHTCIDTQVDEVQYPPAFNFNPGQRITCNTVATAMCDFF